MFTRIKKKLKIFKKSWSIKWRRYDSYLYLTLILITLLIGGLSLFKSTWSFTFEFLKFNVVQLIILFLISILIFYNTYKRLTKTVPRNSQLLIFLLLLGIFIFNSISLNVLITRLSGRALFSTTYYTFLNLSLVCFSILLSIYDFPLLDNIRSLYMPVKESFYKNMGLFVFVFFLAALGGIINRSFLYVVTALILLLHTYLLKGILANLRK